MEDDGTLVLGAGEGVGFRSEVWGGVAVRCLG